MKTTYLFWKMSSNLGGNLFISKDNYLVPMIYLRYLVFHPLAPSIFQPTTPTTRTSSTILVPYKLKLVEGSTRSVSRTNQSGEKKDLTLRLKKGCYLSPYYKKRWVNKRSIIDIRFRYHPKVSNILFKRLENPCLGFVEGE